MDQKKEQEPNIRPLTTENVGVQAVRDAWVWCKALEFGLDPFAMQPPLSPPAGQEPEQTR